jgi:hypothetical protein
MRTLRVFLRMNAALKQSKSLHWISMANMCTAWLLGTGLRSRIRVVSTLWSEYAIVALRELYDAQR